MNQRCGLQHANRTHFVYINAPCQCTSMTEMSSCITRIHRGPWYKQTKSKHNKTVCIFYRMYCVKGQTYWIRRCLHQTRSGCADYPICGWIYFVSLVIDLNWNYIRLFPYLNATANGTFNCRSTFCLHTAPKPIVPWGIWIKLKISNLQAEFSNWWLRYLSWNCPQINVDGPYWW